MELTILVLCIALAVVILVALVFGFLRLKGNYRELQEEVRRSKNPAAQIVAVKQQAGEVRLAYMTLPTMKVVREAPARPAPVPPVPQPAEEPVAAPEAEEQNEETADGILIRRAEKLTFREKYERLPEEDKRYLDEFTAYITEKENCAKVLQTSALLFRYKKGQIAKAAIRRETVVLAFPIANPNLGRMVREEKLKGVKMQPAEIRLDSAEDLALAKQTADITIGYLAKEEQYRIEKRKEARREAARQRREEAEGGETK